MAQAPSEFATGKCKRTTTATAALWLATCTGCIGIRGAHTPLPGNERPGRPSVHAAGTIASGELGVAWPLDQAKNLRVNAGMIGGSMINGSGGVQFLFSDGLARGDVELGVGGVAEVAPGSSDGGSGLGGYGSFGGSLAGFAGHVGLGVRAMVQLIGIAGGVNWVPVLSGGVGVWARLGPVFGGAGLGAVGPGGRFLSPVAEVSLGFDVPLRPPKPAGKPGGS